MSVEPRLSTALRVLVHAITAAVIAFPLTVTAGVVAAAIGGALGSFGARFLAKSALRLHTLALVGLAGMLFVLAARFVVVDLALVPGLLGPSDALKVGEAVLYGLGGLVVSGCLRALSARRPALSVLEAALVAVGFATLLVAHRNGAIHRPYVLSDPLIARGEDPTIAILIIGALGAGVIGLLLLSERSVVRSAFHVAVMAALLLIVLGTTTMNGLPPPPSTGGALGLQDDDRDSRPGQGGQGGQGRRDSDQLEFLDNYPSGNSAPDAIIIFHDDYSSPSGYYYFRQNAFSQYNGRKLIAATGVGLDQDVCNVFPTNRSRDVAWVPAAGTDRMTVETTVGMLADNSAPLGLEAPIRFVPATNPNPERFRRLYRVHSNALTADMVSLLGRELGDESWTEEERAHYLRGPDDPRYRELAEHIIGTLPEHLKDDPVAKALSITQYLGKHGTYSLRSRHAGAEDPTAHFLFGDLTGYCVHFSHAAVYLMRAAGIPSRVGTGYAVAEANRQGGSGLLLRNSDQHAWPEVYVGGRETPPSPGLVALQAFQAAHRDGDLARLSADERQIALMTLHFMVTPEAARIDPAGDAVFPELEIPDLDASTPESTEAELARMAEEAGTTPDALLSGVIAELDALTPDPTDSPDAGWVVMDVAPENVLGSPGEPPDPDLQRLLAEMARGSAPLEDAPQPPRPMAELVREVSTPILQGLGVLLAALFAFFTGNKVRRRAAPMWSASPRAVFIAALDMLSESGVRREWGESHEAFAARMSRELPSLRALTRGHLSWSFGQRPDDARTAAMKAAARALRSELKGLLPWWRRALGWINPFSWLLTR